MEGKEEGRESEAAEGNLCCHVKKKRGEEGKHLRHSIVIIENIFSSLRIQ